MPTQHSISSTSQQYLDIYDITDNLVILKDGGVALILSVTALNFGLLAEEEQDAIIYGYASLLNSLNYPIEIVIRSQTKDVTTYLNSLKQQEDETINRLKKEQIKRYREFVADLVQERNVLDKKFYVVVPATALELGLVSTQSVIPGVKAADVSTFDQSVILQRAKDLLEPKRDHLISQFARIGLQSSQLLTQDIIQLFYTIYNPEASEGQRMTDSRSYTTSVVEGNIEEKVYGETRQQMPENMHETQIEPDVVAAPVAPTLPQTPVQTAPAAPAQPDVSASQLQSALPPIPAEVV